MSISRALQIAALAMVPTMAVADSDMDNKSVKYSGNQDARSVCKAVVQDDPERLRWLLRDYKSGLPHGYAFKIRDRAITGSFTCNGLALKTFSSEINATKVSNFLNTGTVTMEEFVASSAN